MWTRLNSCLVGFGLLAIASPVSAQTYHFSTGNPDGLIGTASRPQSAGKVEIETADDFVVTQEINITSGTFTGLLPANTDATNIGDVVIEIYRVFPLDSTVPPSGNVPTRNNSPSDVAFTSADLSSGGLSLTTSTLSSNFTVANSVINKISVASGGEGAVSGQEVLLSVLLTTPFDLPEGHYFFVPQVQLSDGNFLWLSAPKPIVAPGTPFPGGFTDLQSWMRNETLAPDWLRVGTDITNAGPFNAAFSLDGAAIPEPTSWAMMLVGFAAVGWTARRRHRRHKLAA